MNVTDQELINFHFLPISKILTRIYITERAIKSIIIKKHKKEVRAYSSYTYIESMVSIAIEAGPIEFREKTSSEKVTVCLMSDNTVSERRYRANGQLFYQAAHPPKKDLDQGLQALMSRC